MRTSVVFTVILAALASITTQRASASDSQAKNPSIQRVKAETAREPITHVLYQNPEKTQEEPYYRNEVITNSVPDRPFVESKTSFVLPDGRLAYHVRRSGVRITRTEKGLEKIEDFDTGTTEVYYRGGKIEPIVDSVSNCGIEPSKPQPDPEANPAETWVYISYNRFDVYIGEGFYNANHDAKF